MKHTRNELRLRLRHMRRALPARVRQRAAHAIARRLLRLPLLKPGARIGVYLAMDGELDLHAFMQRAWQRGCRLFIPHIRHGGRRQMQFQPLLPKSRLRAHRWGVAQLHRPVQPVATLSLDVVLVPLVGFDARGYRLGMGAGFYDRHFAYLNRPRHWRRPYLIGVAFACQYVDALPVLTHDVPLPCVMTETAVYTHS